MASIQDSAFDNFAGQLIASGVRPNQPLAALEATVDANVIKNLELIGGLMPKCSDVIIHETRVFNNPVDGLFQKGNVPFGAYIEHAQFVSGAPNKKNDGRCVPRGSVDMATQLNVINFAYDVDIDVKDREVNMGVMNAEQAGSYVASKLRLPMKTISAEKYRAEVQILSDVIDGTRSITSSDSSDGTGATVSYAPSVTGYAGVVEKSNTVLAPVELQQTPAFASGSAATDMIKSLKAAARDMAVENSDYNVLGVDNFIIGKPVAVMESKVLDALDDALALDGTDKRIPTRTAREYIGTFADITEIDSFAALPTNSSYADYRLGAVLIDRDACYEHIQYTDMESQRCAKQRLTGYNYQGASAISIYRGAPAYAYLTKKE